MLSNTCYILVCQNLYRSFHHYPLVEYVQACNASSLAALVSIHFSQDVIDCSVLNTIRHN